MWLYKNKTDPRVFGAGCLLDKDYRAVLLRFTIVNRMQTTSGIARRIAPVSCNPMWVDPLMESVAALSFFAQVCLY